MTTNPHLCAPFIAPLTHNRLPFSYKQQFKIHFEDMVAGNHTIANTGAMSSVKELEIVPAREEKQRAGRKKPGKRSAGRPRVTLYNTLSWGQVKQ